jgi:hypothetical protein
MTKEMVAAVAVGGHNLISQPGGTHFDPLAVVARR